MFKYFLLLNALALSAVAAYYSIVGLVVIFAASMVPVAIMASVLEVGKLVIATYLHNNWNNTNIVLKSYLTLSVAALMLITSLGIFGFLSKAHIEQSLFGRQVAQEMQQIDQQIAFLEKDQIDSLSRAEDVIATKKQQTFDEISNINKQIELSQNKLVELSNLTNTVDIQKLVGVKPDGAFGPMTAKAIKEFEVKHENRISKLNDRVRELNDRLEKDLQSVVIIKNEDKIKELTNERFNLERQTTQLEAEVGPIKYVAEMIYGQSNVDLMEKAVRWLILLLVAVFDPLAIAMLLAFNQINKRKDNVFISEEVLCSVQEERIEPTFAGEGEAPKVQKEQPVVEPVAPSEPVAKQPKQFKKRKRVGKVAAAKKTIE